MSYHTVLIVDDEEDILEEYKGLFEDFPVKLLTSTEPKKAIEILSSDNITVLVTDQKMPEISGLELVEKAKETSPDTIRMILTGYAEQDMMVEAINVGQVFKFLVKPCDPEKFVSAVMDAVDYYKEREKVQKTIYSRGVYTDAKSDMEVMQSQLQEREAEIQMLISESERQASMQQENFKAIFSFLVYLIRTKNESLFQNGRWVADFATKIAKLLVLSDQDQNIVRMAGYFKNIGLILLPDLCTEKPIGMFSSNELKQYYRFPAIGEQILKKLPGFGHVAVTIGHILERYDGSGPKGIGGDKIPISAQIISMADDTYKILFARSKKVDKETVYGRTFMMNHIRKNLKRLYGIDVARATIKVLEKGSI